MAVVLSTALLGIGLPAAKQAELSRNTELAGTELDRVAQAAARLTSNNDPLHQTQTPASTTIVLDHPASTFTDPGRFHIGSDEFRWVLPEGYNRTRVPEAAVYLDAPIVASKTVRLQLSLVRLDGKTVVRIDTDWTRI